MFNDETIKVEVNTNPAGVSFVLIMTPEVYLCLGKHLTHRVLLTQWKCTMTRLGHCNTRV